MGTRFNPVGGWSLEDTNRLLHIYERMKRRSVSVEFDDFPDFCQWARVSKWKYGMKLVRKDQDGPYSPDNCTWREVVQKSEADKRELDFAQQWNNLVIPIRERYAADLAAIADESKSLHTKTYFRYEHPDLVREGIVFEMRTD